MSDFLFQDHFHQLSNWIVTAVFPSPYLWMHVVVLIVLVAMPLAFLALLSAWGIGAVRRRLSGSRKEMPRDVVSPFPSNLFLYILKHTRKEQSILLVTALLSLPLLYAVLELPKQIINKALNVGNDTSTVIGYVLSKCELLFILCIFYLGAVLTSGALKYVINLLQGRLAEGMMRRMRFAAFRAWSRGKTPCDHALFIPVLVQEVEPIAGFTGDTFLVPVLRGGRF